ncbi:hydrolase_4 domain-containing protein [Haematococcus lacustris]|uniref:Hydrolase_4 domain-containing protein n=1 Tax=Haematococcus lacustris TaxID=44745 RepID=A0A6A0A830_HAELA|nr:hydrolase_4 domain-containing protein [Haematococcus lacustris]
MVAGTRPSLAIVGGGSDNREVDIQASFTQDPLTSKCKATRVRNALEYLRACAQLEEDVSQGPGCRFPFIVFHAKEDEWTSSEGSCHLYRHSKAQDKSLRLLEGGTHTLTKGAEGQQLLQEVRQWLLQRTADVAAAR